MTRGREHGHTRLAGMQKTKGADKKLELQAQLTRVQQQIQEERSKRRKEAWEAEHKVSLCLTQSGIPHSSCRECVTH